MQSTIPHHRSEPAEAGCPLGAKEVRRLWWLLDGAIMNADTRLALRRTWGLCPRHAWSMAQVESELRGGVLLATSVLYADLALGAAAAVEGRHLRSSTHQFTPHGSCLTCDHVEHAHEEPRDWVKRAEVVNRHARFAPLLAESWDLAAPYACGPCIGGDGPTCLPHLLGGRGDGEDLARRLGRLAVRMHAYEKSLTVDGRPVDERGQAAWIATLGWFAGWRFPAALVGAPAQQSRRAR